MRRPKPTTSFATQPDFTITAADAAIIARALHEAANRHDDPVDMAMRFRDDPDVAREMRSVLEKIFPDRARAFADADALRDALSKGYLPAPAGSSPEAVKLFLLQHKTARDFHRAATTPRDSHYDLGDPDFPF